MRSLDTDCILFDQFDLCKFNNRSSTVFKFTESLFWKLDFNNKREVRIDGSVARVDSPMLSCLCSFFRGGVAKSWALKNIESLK